MGTVTGSAQVIFIIYILITTVNVQVIRSWVCFSSSLHFFLWFNPANRTKYSSIFQRQGQKFTISFVFCLYYLEYMSLYVIRYIYLFKIHKTIYKKAQKYINMLFVVVDILSQQLLSVIVVVVEWNFRRSTIEHHYIEQVVHRIKLICWLLDPEGVIRRQISDRQIAKDWLRQSLLSTDEGFRQKYVVASLKEVFWSQLGESVISYEEDRYILNHCGLFFSYLSCYSQILCTLHQTKLYCQYHYKKKETKLYCYRIIKFFLQVWFSFVWCNVPLICKRVVGFSAQFK